MACWARRQSFSTLSGIMGTPSPGGARGGRAAPMCIDRDDPFARATSPLAMVSWNHVPTAHDPCLPPLPLVGEGRYLSDPLRDGEALAVGPPQQAIRLGVAGDRLGGGVELDGPAEA